MEITEMESKGFLTTQHENLDLGPYIPDDSIDICIDGMQRLSNDNKSNIIYLLAKALANNDTEDTTFNTESLSFKILEVMICALHEESLATTKSLAHDVLTIFDQQKYTNKTFITAFNEILFPFKNLRFGYVRGKHRYDLFEVTKVVKEKDGGNSDVENVDETINSVKNIAESSLNSMNENAESSFQENMESSVKSKQGHKLCMVDEVDKGKVDGNSDKKNMDKTGNEQRESTVTNVTENAESFVNSVEMKMEKSLKSKEENNDLVETYMEEVVDCVVGPNEENKLDGIQLDDKDLMDTINNAELVMYRCEFCSVVFKRLASLRKHVRECKSKDEAKEIDDEELSDDDDFCEEEDMDYDQTESVPQDDEELTVTGKRRKRRLLPHPTPYSCKKCSNYFKSDVELQVHIYKNSCLSCKECKLTFTLRKDWETHFRDTHAKRLFPCPHCDKQFGRLSNLKKHVRSYHQKIRDYSCSICNTGFFEKKDLKKHEEKCIAQESECRYCDGIFPTQKLLLSHLRQKHSVFPCSKCSEIYSSSKELALHHKDLHLKQKTTCDWCGETVLSKEMVKHKRLKHSEQYGKEKCKDCDKTFSSPYYLKRHYRIVHEKQRNFFCEVCGKRFSNSAHLNEHFGVHDNIIRYKCEQCDEGFVHRASYKRHMIKHLGLQLFQCSICNRKFDTPEYLKSHAKRVHKCTVKIDNFETPGSTLPDHMRSRKKGGRQHNKISNLENIKDSKIEITVKSEDANELVAKSIVNINSSTYQPHPKSKAVLKVDPLFVDEVTVTEIQQNDPETKYDVQEVDLESHQLVQVEEEGGETKIYYVPHGTGFLQIGDKTINLEGI